MVAIETVQSVYSGKAGRCCCGCSGKHYYASAHVEEAGKNRGYQIQADEISDRMVARVVNLLNANAEGLLDKDSEMVSVTINGRLYIAYLRA